jgi:hypothetical protein
MIPLAQPCTCGKTWAHCVRCSSQQVYKLKNKSMVESAKAGRKIEVMHCKVCQEDFRTSDPCKGWDSEETKLHKKISKLKDQDVEIEPSVDTKPKEKVPSVTPVVEPTGPSMTLADLINRKEPSPEDGRE